LKLAAGVWAPSEGVLERYGDAVGEDGGDPRIGYLGHQSLLYRALIGLENLEFFGRLYGLRIPRVRAEAMLRRVGLRRVQGDPVARYSRGMEQRCAIARVFLHEPSLLLLDEPYTGLDVEARGILDALVRETVAMGGAAVYTTHVLDDVERESTRGAVLWRGDIRQADRGGARAAAVLYENLLHARDGRESRDGRRHGT
jgi:heme exporter protein A